MIDLIGRSTWISLFRVSEQSDTVVPVVPPPAQGGKHYHKWPMVVLAPSGCYTCATSSACVSGDWRYSIVVRFREPLLYVFLYVFFLKLKYPVLFVCLFFSQSSIRSSGYRNASGSSLWDQIPTIIIAIMIIHHTGLGQRWAQR